MAVVCEAHLQVLKTLRYIKILVLWQIHLASSYQDVQQHEMELTLDQDFTREVFKGTASLDYGFRSLYLSTAIHALIAVFPPLGRFEILFLSLLHLFYTFWQAEIIFPGSSCSPVSFSLHAHFTGSGSLVWVIFLTSQDNYTPWLWECWNCYRGFCLTLIQLPCWNFFKFWIIEQSLYFAWV